MKASHVVAAIALVVAGFAGGLGVARLGVRREPAAAASQPRAVKYHCPMHPDYVSDRPGECPICGMKLVPIGGAPPSGGEAGSPDGAGAPTAGSAPIEAVAPVPGAIHISAEKQQLIGVTYGIVEPSRATRTVRAAGTVTVDETSVVKVHTRVEGWIDQVQVDFTGKPVQKGQTLLTLYSPDMLATQQELLLAIRHRDRARAAAQSATSAGSTTGVGAASFSQDLDGMARAARRRLQLWGLSDAQLDEVERTGSPITNVSVRAPISGHVLTRGAFPGQRVVPDTELYSIADLSRVWVVADVLQADAPLVRPGTPVRISVAYTGQEVAGRVSFIQPQVDPESRGLKVRVEVSNPRLALKPDMFVEMTFDVATEAQLTVPSSALLDSGTRQVVFVDRGNGFLEPRPVTVGARLGDRVAITGGLTAGERVVTSGTFLIDSETQLKAVPAGTGPQPGAVPAPAPGGPPSPEPRAGHAASSPRPHGPGAPRHD